MQQQQRRQHISALAYLFMAAELGSAETPTQRRAQAKERRKDESVNETDLARPLEKVFVINSPFAHGGL